MCILPSVCIRFHYIYHNTAVYALTAKYFVTPFVLTLTDIVRPNILAVCIRVNTAKYFGTRNRI